MEKDRCGYVGMVDCCCHVGTVPAEYGDSPSLTDNQFLLVLMVWCMAWYCCRCSCLTGWLAGWDPTGFRRRENLGQS